MELVTDDREHVYDGYIPALTPDFFLATSDSLTEPIPPSLVPPPPQSEDARRFHRPAIVFSILCIIAAVLSLVLAVTSAGCSLTLCDRLDHSSLPSDSGYPQPLPFTAPLPTALVALAISFCVLATMSFVLRIVSSRAEVAEPPISLLATHVRHITLSLQQRVALATCTVAVPVFIIIGFAVSWRTSVAFLIGIIPTLVSSSIALSAVTRASPRAATAAVSKSILSAFVIATRAAAVAPLAAQGLTFAALLTTYLLVRSINALLGFVFGVAFTAFIIRITSAMYAVPPPSATSLRFSQDDVRNPAAVIPSVGAHFAAVSAHVAEACLLFCTPVVLTAVLGTSLPFFENNPYAMCVHNHLEIDRTCVAYTEPSDKISLAVNLCRQNGFYELYPSLSNRQSNSFFVALPFLLAVLVTITMMSSALLSLRKQRDPRDRLKMIPDSHFSRTVLRPLLTQALLDQVVRFVVSSIAALALLLLVMGPRSPFTRANSVSVQRYQFPSDVSMDRTIICEPASAPNSGLPSNVYPRLEIKSTRYRPVDVYGAEMPPAQTLVWRMFACFELGLLCGVLTAVLCAYVGWAMNEPARMASALSSDGFDSEVASAASGSALGAAVGSTLVISAGALCYRILEGYGLGLGAIGLVCSLGPAIEMGVVSQIGKEARRLCIISRFPRAQIRYTDFLAATGDLFDGWSKGIFAACTIFASLTTSWVVVQMSGIIPVARELAGVSVASLPTKHVTDLEKVDSLSVSSIAAVLHGMTLPFALCGAIGLSAAQLTASFGTSIINEIRRRGQWEEAATGTYDTCCNDIARMSGMASLAPIVVGLFSALGGLWSGLRIWMGVVIGSVASGSVVSFFFALVGNRLQGVKLVDKLNDDESSCQDFRAQHSGFWKWNEVTEEWISGCIRVFLMMLAIGGVLSVSSMNLQKNRWWSLLVVSFVWMILFGISHILMPKLRKRQLPSSNNNAEHNETRDWISFRVNPRVVSPFFEAGPTIPYETMAPQCPLRYVKIEDEREILDILQ